MKNKVWLITDTHFGHKKMIDYCNRPEGFEDVIFDNLSSAINEDDILIHLGDVNIGQDYYWHTLFHDDICGKHILVKGNHDNKSNHWYLNHGWDFVCDHFSDIYFGKKILFSHAPMKADNYDLNIHGHFHNALPRLQKGEWKADGEKERNEQDLLNLLSGKHKLLAIEYTNYEPVLLENFIKEENDKTK